MHGMHSYRFVRMRLWMRHLRRGRFMLEMYENCNPGISLTLVYSSTNVKISVDEWILETTHPHKHVAIFGFLFVNVCI